MRGTQWHLAALALVAAAACMSSVLAAPESRFNKKIDTHSLDKEYLEQDVDDEEWHEDSWEWKEKKKRRFHPDDPESLLRAARSGGPMEMLFVSLKDEMHETKEETERLTVRWSAMMKTGGVQASVYPIKENSVIFTSPDGQLGDVMDFVLEQPEVKLAKLKGTDYFPPKKPLSRREKRQRKKERERKMRAGGSNPGFQGGAAAAKGAARKAARKAARDSARKAAKASRARKEEL